MRTDKHRLATLDPAEYSAVASFVVPSEDNDYLGDFDYSTSIGETEEQAIAYLGSNRAPDLKPAPDSEIGLRSCDLCGQGHAKTYVAYRHNPTGEILWTGHICAEKIGLASREDLDALRQGDRRELAKVRGEWVGHDPLRRRAIDYLTSKVVEFVESREDVTVDNAHHFGGEFVVSLFFKWQRNGDLSERQVEALLDGPRRDAERSAKLAAEREVLADRPEIVEWLEANEPKSDPDERDFEDDYRAAKKTEIRNSILRRYESLGSITDGQIRIVEKEIGATSGEPVPTGRTEISGSVVSTKEVADHYSYHGGTISKMLVEDDRGFRVFGTVPSAILGVEKGDRVSFTATLSPSDDDPSFGFFKRPTKASADNEKEEG